MLIASRAIFMNEMREGTTKSKVVLTALWVWSGIHAIIACSNLNPGIVEEFMGKMPHLHHVSSLDWKLVKYFVIMMHNLRYTWMVFKNQLLLLLHPTEIHSRAFIKTSRKVYFVGYLAKYSVGLYHTIYIHCFLTCFGPHPIPASSQHHTRHTRT